MPDTTTWEEYCEASLDLSNQDDVGDNELAACAYNTHYDSLEIPECLLMTLQLQELNPPGAN